MNLAEIVRLTGMHRSALNRYLDYPEIRQALGGGESHPDYPQDSLPMFQHLATLREGRQKTPPKELAQKLRFLAENPDNRTLSELPVNRIRDHADGAQLVLAPGSSIDVTSGDLQTLTEAYLKREDALEAILGRLVAMQESRFELVEDRLIDAVEVGKILLCSADRARELLKKADVLPVAGRRPFVWKLSAVRAYVSRL